MYWFQIAFILGNVVESCVSPALAHQHPELSLCLIFQQCIFSLSLATSSYPDDQIHCESTLVLEIKQSCCIARPKPQVVKLAFENQIYYS